MRPSPVSRWAGTFSRLWTMAGSFRKGAVGTVMLANGLVAVAAFLKDVLIAAYAGTSPEADALTLAYFVPDTIGSSLLAGAAAVACVPAFAELLAKGSVGQAGRLIRRSLRFFAGMSILLLAVFYLFGPGIIHVMAGGGLAAELTYPLYVIIAPIVVFSAFAAIGTAALQAEGRFGVPAAAPLWLHGLVGGAAALCLAAGAAPAVGIRWIAAAILVGASVTAAWIWLGWGRRRPEGASHAKAQDASHGATALDASQGAKAHDASVGANVQVASHGANAPQVVLTGVPAEHSAPTPLARNAPRTADEVSGDGGGFGKIWRAFVPYLLILAATHAVYAFERALASRYGEGTVAALNYAFRVSQVPVWIYATAVSTAALPLLAKLTAAGQRKEAAATLNSAVRNMLAITIPTSWLLYLFREPILSILFERGSFDEHSLAVTSEIFAGYAVALAGLSVTALMLRYFIAAGEMRLPFAVLLASALANAAADALLLPVAGPAGLGWGAAMGAAISALGLLAALCRRLGTRLRPALGAWLALAAASLPFAACIAAAADAGRRFGLHGWAALLPLLLALPLGAGAYLLTLRTFRLLR